MAHGTRIVYVDPGATGEVSTAASTAAFTVEVVASVAACLERLPSADCVVTSDRLPDASPADLCRQVRDRRADLPIVVFPVDGSEALAGEVIAAGADGYVPRSQGVETLVSRLDELVEHDRHDDRAAAHVGSSADPSDRLALLVEQSPLAIVEWTLDRTVGSWNPAAADLFGYSASEAVGKQAMELLVPEEHHDTIDQYWADLVDEDVAGSVSRRVVQNVRKDGSTITCEWFSTPLVDDGEVVSVLSFAQDVTRDIKRANALEALQETTNELMRAESVAEIGEIVMDATEHVIDQSLAGIRFYDDETGTLSIAATTSRLEVHSGDLSTVGPDDGLLWSVYQDGEPTVIDDASADMVPYDLDRTVGNAILHPLGEHGLLTVASSGRDDLDVVDIHLVHVLAATAEAALDRAVRERELERTKTVVETVGDSVYALDRKGRFVTVNDTLTELTGYDREELLGEHVSTVLTAESVERGQKRVRALLSAADHRVATYEVTAEAADGERIAGEVNMTLLWSDGELEGTVGIFRDISDRKRMQRELVDRKAKIESLHEIASRLDDCETREAVFELTVDAAERVLNFDVCVADEIDGEYLAKKAISSNLDDADYVERIHVEEGIAGKTYRNRRTYRIGDVADAEDAAGEADKYQSLLSVPIGDHGVFQAVATDRNAFDADDQELAELLLSHVSDTLDRLAFESELKAERDRFVALFENVPDAVVSVRELGSGPTVEEVNPAFERLFGYDAETVVGEPLDRFIVPADRAADADRLNAKGGRGEPVEAEVKRRTADGLRDFMLRVVPMQMDERSERAFGLYTDITEQKQRQQRVEILNRVLRHDLRNGMNIITGCAQMLAEAVEGDDVEYAQTIQERASELISLAEKTRAVERTLERGEAATGPVNIAEAVQQAASRLESTYPEVEVTCSVTDDIYARTDEYFQTAVFQVLENAIEHNDEPTPTVDVELRNCQEDGMVTLSIADNGPGMPAEERALLQEDEEITQLRHASGLGLWLVNWVVTRSGGQLRFDENDPRGTIVTLEIPRADVESARSGADGTVTGD
ncbi:PAS domain S-box protein [Halosolutus amylolyticus]|uniref:histidine kinase n=1 Tax=Halosolutus amylolyticus TaxID=2932267 RepID=A0ABD5PTN2_9EURY|nr:PAS domain S-box protein [Halosolutus amylolyticus]